ncbi:ABC transporter ATP-binding protein [bacterium]|nr:ABC transporter ATP-binding protein [bacterium]
MALSEHPPLFLRDVTKRYGSLCAVDGLSFGIEEGEIFGLLGQNGAGKSTLINMIVGLTKKDSGSIQVFGHDVEQAYRITRRLIGVMHQELVIEKFFSIGEALKLHAGYYGVKDDPQWRKRLIEHLDLSPHLEKKYLALSGGMKRRFMVAKAMIHRPRLLILDEPTAGVDVELRRGLWDFVSEINREGTTILLTTHYLEEAEQMCGRVGIMHLGKLIALEKTADLIRKTGERKIHLRFRDDASPVQNYLRESRAVELLPSLSDDRRTITVPISHETDVGELLAVVHQLALPLEDIHTEQSALEDVFVKLTSEE